MPSLPDLIREYCELLDQETFLDKRKAEIKARIEQLMAIQGVGNAASPFGSVMKKSRFKLTPRRDAVLNLLQPEDLLPFAQFSSAKVTEILVPKYGREQLLPLFEVEKTEYLQVKRPTDK